MKSKTIIEQDLNIKNVNLCKLISTKEYSKLFNVFCKGGGIIKHSISIKVILFIMFIFFQFSYSQTIQFSYNESVELELDIKLDKYILLENTIKKTKSIVIVDEDKKVVLVSRKLEPSDGGNTLDSAEIYYFIKKELTKSGNGYKYFSVDLVNKKYLEIVICDDYTAISDNCNFFYGCQHVTTLKK